jgi:hypothetical protein
MIVFATQAARGRKFRRFTNLKVATLLWDRFFPFSVFLMAKMKDGKIFYESSIFFLTI